jgi:DNA-binding MarR family transcriptional regulator
MRKRNEWLRLVPPVHRATHRIGLYLQRRRDLGVSQGEAHVLAHLWDAGPCTVGRLHAAFAHRRSTLTGILDRLEAAGLVRRELRPADRRSFLVTLTAKGRTRARRVRAALGDLEARVARRVGPAELAGFAAVARALAQEAAGDGGKEDP